MLTRIYLVIIIISYKKYLPFTQNNSHGNDHLSCVAYSCCFIYWIKSLYFKWGRYTHTYCNLKCEQQLLYNLGVLKFKCGTFCLLRVVVPFQNNIQYLPLHILHLAEWHQPTCTPCFFYVVFVTNQNYKWLDFFLLKYQIHC